MKNWKFSVWESTGIQNFLNQWKGLKLQPRKMQQIKEYSNKTKNSQNKKTPWSIFLEFPDHVWSQ